MVEMMVQSTDAAATVALVGLSTESVTRLASSASSEKVVTEERPTEGAPPKDPVGRATEAAGAPKLARMTKIVDPPERAMSIPNMPLIGAWAEASQPNPPFPSTVETLRAIAEFLGGYLSPEERLALEREGARHQMVGAFRSLALVGYYLADFVGVSSGISSLEFVEAKEIDRLKYYLEQDKATNVELVKELDCSEKALFEAREMIDHRDDELEWVHRRIEVLERQRPEAERDYRRAREDIDRLRRTLEGRRNSTPRACSPKDSDKRPNKRPRTSDGAHRGEESSWRDEGLSVRGMLTIPEPSTSQIEL
ncbi:hypothetical protein COCNU_scaffold001517G000030 [Cocos nucifera]|nr:hypothetical protein [Cocos nucifera]